MNDDWNNDWQDDQPDENDPLGWLDDEDTDDEASDTPNFLDEVETEATSLPPGTDTDEEVELEDLFAEMSDEDFTDDASGLEWLEAEELAESVDQAELAVDDFDDDEDDPLAWLNQEGVELADDGESVGMTDMLNALDEEDDGNPSSGFATPTADVPLDDSGRDWTPWCQTCQPFQTGTTQTGVQLGRRCTFEANDRSHGWIPDGNRDCGKSSPCGQLTRERCQCNCHCVIGDRGSAKQWLARQDPEIATAGHQQYRSRAGRRRHECRRRSSLGAS